MYDVAALRQANPIAAVIEDAGVELRRTGNRFTGCCPLHADSEPSLVVYPETQSYYCFSCCAGGDVIDFVSRLRKVGFKEAAALLDSRSIEPITLSALPICAAPCTRSASTEELEVIDFAVSRFATVFWQSRNARNSLRKRGIDETTAGRCRIGFGHPGLAADLQRAGLSLDAAREVGLLDRNRNVFGGRLVIPNLVQGKANWLTGRSVNGEGPRYLNLRLPSPLLGLDQVAGSEVVLTEGPFDWLSLVQWGYPAAALVGTHVSRGAVQELSRFERVYLAMDNDDAGRRATDALRADLGAKAVAVPLPEWAHDVNDLVSYSDGESLFRACITEARKAAEVEAWAGHVSSAA